jgi:ADP-ribose pyrophosphatase YjhB (NUDIX family)
MPVPLYEHPKHLVAVDCIIFGYEDDELKLLLSPRRFEPALGEWSLMGGWVQEDETVEKAAERVLYQITGLKDIYLEQVYVFSNPERDPGGRVISVVFYAMIRIDKHDKELVKEHGAVWWTFSEKPDLIFDHNQMVEYAHEKLKLKAGYSLIGENLLPERFTILQLRTLYEAIFQRQFDPGNFRKKILSLKILEKLKDKDTTASKKGAFYYRFKEHKKEFIHERIVKQ